ncbi:hypothetical protein VKT23_014019 [Stygiomarasmius scandens]|uniref:Uncharacterized protein n=1 Tax=Marasmiellus scandens TaxID=2682957 RepID=A0ABR1J5D9_9AGAR
MPSYTHTVSVTLSRESTGEHDVRVVFRPGNLEIDGHHSFSDDSLNVRVHVSSYSASDQATHSDSSSDISSSASIPPDSDSDSRELSSVYTPMSVDESSSSGSSDLHLESLASLGSVYTPMSVDESSSSGSSDLYLESLASLDSSFRARLRSMSPRSEPTAINSESSHADFSFSDTDSGFSVHSSSVSAPSHDNTILSDTDELSSIYTSAMSSIDNSSNSDTSDEGRASSDSLSSIELVSAILFCSYDIEVSGYPVAPQQFLACLPGKLMVAYTASSTYVYIGLRGSYKPLVILPASSIDLEESFRYTDSVLEVYRELFIGDMQGVLRSRKTRLSVTFLQAEQFLAFKDALKFTADMGTTEDVSEWSALFAFYTNLDREIAN